MPVVHTQHKHTTPRHLNPTKTKPETTQGLLVTRNGEAERLTELSANPKSHVARLQEYGARQRAEGDVRACVDV